jgi:hypothetical protein
MFGFSMDFSLLLLLVPLLEFQEDLSRGRLGRLEAYRPSQARCLTSVIGAGGPDG